MRNRFGVRGYGLWIKPDTCPHSPAPKGFTLIELAVVLVILSIVAVLVLPRLFAGDELTLQRSARSLAATLRYLQDRAITSRSVYNLHVKFPEGTISIAAATPTGEEGATGDPVLGNNRMDETVNVEDVVVASRGRINDGEVIVPFGLAGLQELLTIHLKSRNGGKYTIIAYPASGKVRIEEGYREAAL